MSGKILFEGKSAQRPFSFNWNDPGTAYHPLPCSSIQAHFHISIFWFLRQNNYNKLRVISI